jgi:uncharacterized membrane protein
MNTPNKVLMAQARESLKGKWKLGVKVTLLIFLVGLILRFIPLLGPIAQILIAGPIMLGLASFYLALSRNQNATLGKAFEGFNTWWRAFKAYVLMVIYMLFWFMLLIIPGLIYSLAFSQVFFILAEDKNIRIRDAFYKSRMMMKGNKWKLFCLMLRFLGWGLLALLTLGVGFLWLNPYMQTAAAKFYDDIKDNVKMKEVEVEQATVTA